MRRSNNGRAVAIDRSDRGPPSGSLARVLALLEILCAPDRCFFGREPDHDPLGAVLDLLNPVLLSAHHNVKLLHGWTMPRARFDSGENSVASQS
jgi:hypothetical protein